MRRKYEQQEDDIVLDMTPMLDIVFIMLIFFIVSTSFVKESGVDVSSPAAATAEKKELGNIMIALTANGEVWIDKRNIDVRSVRANVERLHAENPEGTVVIQADKDSKNGLLISVIDQARLAGVSNVSVAAIPRQ
ncbi:MAG: biopolymer transporter ExbD [Gammaproteobacteria bacterium]|nr:biopolymer transporter ExbD [Gammaproteobacteria bacterium]